MHGRRCGGGDDGGGGGGAGLGFGRGSGAVTVSVAFRVVPPYFAEMVTVILTATDEVSTAKDPVDSRAGTVTLGGTLATSLSLVSRLTTVDDSTGALNVTTPFGCPCC